MTVREIYVKAEITMWEILIAVMLGSRTVQAVLCKAHDIAYRQPWILRLPKPVYWATAGIGIGFFFGFLGALLTP
jgi:hypothetical protein